LIGLISVILLVGIICANLPSTWTAERNTSVASSNQARHWQIEIAPLLTRSDRKPLSDRPAASRSGFRQLRRWELYWLNPCLASPHPAL